MKSTAILAASAAASGLMAPRAGADEKEKKEESAMNTADILVERLIAWDVSVVFGLIGDGINHITEALRKQKDKIRLITVRHGTLQSRCAVFSFPPANPIYMTGQIPHPKGGDAVNA